MFKKNLSKIIQNCILILKKYKTYCGHGFKNYYEEVMYTISQILKLKTTKYIKYKKIYIKKNTLNKIYKIIKKRAKKKIPLGYLFKKITFCNKMFYLNKYVMIPRTPIGYIIQKKIKLLKKKNEILDLCTGSGCIAIIYSYYYPNTKIYASDISQKALQIAHKNIIYHKKKNITLIKSDLFKNIRNKKFDLIISNPPYINIKDKNFLPKEYQYEPYISLYARNQGIKIITTIIQQSYNYLKNDGYLICEVGHQKNKIIKIFKKISFKWIKVNNKKTEIFYINKKQLKKFYIKQTTKIM